MAAGAGTGKQQRALGSGGGVDRRWRRGFGNRRRLLQAQQILGNRIGFAGRQTRQTQADRAHRASRSTVPGDHVGTQIINQLLAVPRIRPLPQTDQRRGVPAVDAAAVQVLGGFFRADQVQRRMTAGAMSRSVDQITSAVPRRAAFGQWRQRFAVAKQQVPERHQRTNVHREIHLVLPRRRLHSGAAHQVRIGIGDVLGAHAPVVHVGKRRVEKMPVTRYALAHRPFEGRQRPLANAGLRVRGDVGAVQGAERRHQWQSTGQIFTAGAGMADRAIAGFNDPRTAVDLRRIEYRRALDRRYRRAPHQQHGRNQSHRSQQRNGNPEGAGFQPGQVHLRGSGTGHNSGGRAWRVMRSSLWRPGKGADVCASDKA